MREPTEKAVGEIGHWRDRAMQYWRRAVERDEDEEDGDGDDMVEEDTTMGDRWLV